MADSLALHGEPARYRCPPKYLQTKYLPQTAAARVTLTADSGSLTPEKSFVSKMLNIYSKIDIKINILGNRFTARVAQCNLSSLKYIIGVIPSRTKMGFAIFLGRD